MSIQDEKRAKLKPFRKRKPVKKWRVSLTVEVDADLDAFEIESLLANLVDSGLTLDDKKQLHNSYEYEAREA